MHTCEPCSMPGGPLRMPPTAHLGRGGRRQGCQGRKPAALASVKHWLLSGRDDRRRRRRGCGSSRRGSLAAVAIGGWLAVGRGHWRRRRAGGGGGRLGGGLGGRGRRLHGGRPCRRGGGGRGYGSRLTGGSGRGRWRRRRLAGRLGRLGCAAAALRRQPRHRYEAAGVRTPCRQQRNHAPRPRWHAAKPATVRGARIGPAWHTQPIACMK
jgi:hypothetical protein